MNPSPSSGVKHLLLVGEAFVGWRWHKEESAIEIDIKLQQ
jgi:hypothetical protein